MSRIIADWGGIPILLAFWVISSARAGQVVVSITSLVVATTLVAGGLPLYLGRIRPNQILGFYTRKTLGSARAWYRANRIAGFWYILTGLAVAGVTVSRWIIDLASPSTSLAKRVPEYAAWVALPWAGLEILVLLALATIARVIHGIASARVAPESADAISALDPWQQHNELRAVTRARLALYAHIIVVSLCVMGIYERAGIRLFEGEVIGNLMMVLTPYCLLFPVCLGCVALPMRLWRWLSLMIADLALCSMQIFALTELSIRY